MTIFFGTSKIPVKVIKEGAFGGTCFRDIYSGINDRWYRQSLKEFDELKNIEKKYCCSNYFDTNVNKYEVKCGTIFRFLENKAPVNYIDHEGWFKWYSRYYFDRRSSDDKRQIARWNGVVSIFKGKLVEMIKDTNGKFDDYSISLKIR